MNCGLRGRNVLVTGGATGIALANARAFLAEGVHAPFGVAATGMACDLSDPDQAVVLADLARASAPVDVWTNIVGVLQYARSSRPRMPTGSGSSTST
jgi:NAD(P)-dependent dehydrogenase (short-subunit alcohol dehydrogenase family)